MRKTVITALAIISMNLAFAQVDTTAPRKNTAILNEGRSSNDHILIQLGHTVWNGRPDTINTKGWSRSFAAYLMMDFPFKTNTHWSVALGPGVSAENVFFDKMYVGIKDNTSSITFTDISDTSHFKKYKLTTAYLELPVELRYRFNPNDDRRSVKIAVGAKIGTLVNAHTKGKELRNKNGDAISDYIVKENSKRFFNKNRLSVMGRIGFGHFSFFTTYAITPLFREGFGPEVRPLTMGLTLSGL